MRWLIFGALLGFSFFGYIERSEVSIIGEPMMREFGLSQPLFGWLVTAFLVGYTGFGIPTAILGERIGARRAITLSGGATVLAICLIAVLPRLQTLAVTIVLLAVQLFLGIAQAALYPVFSGAIREWLPRRVWGLAQGLSVTSAWMGSAVAPPLISTLLVIYGWRVAMLVTCIPSLLLLLWWQRHARDRPSEHPDVTAEEMADLDAEDAVGPTRQASFARAIRLLGDAQLLRLTLAYLLTNYVFYLVMFWAFLYLRQARHMTVLESGWLASLPFLCAAGAAALGGRLSDFFSARLGLSCGMRVVPLLALPCAALFLWLTGVASGVLPAVVCLCLAFGFCEIVEGPFWSAAMRLAPEDTMTSTAILNTGGNLGGVIATPIIGALSVHQRWGTVFLVGALTSVAAALLWLKIDVSGTAPRRERSR